MVEASRVVAERGAGTGIGHSLPHDVGSRWLAARGGAAVLSRYSGRRALVETGYEAR